MHTGIKRTHTHEPGFLFPCFPAPDCGRNRWGLEGIESWEDIRGAALKMKAFGIRLLNKILCK